MYNNIAIIHDHPAVACKTLLPALHFMLLFNVVNDRVSQRVEHAVAGAGADNKIVCKGDNPLQVEQENILTLFVFKGIYNFTCKF